MKKILIIVLLGGAANLLAQPGDSLLVIGQKAQLYSQELEEHRNYWIHLPAGYDQSLHQEYPVLYLLDGEQNFATTVGILAFLDRGPRAQFPKAIVVGIVNTDRTRDFTPTKAVSVKGNATLENSGGGERFIRFLERELIPHIEGHYRTSEKKVLIGHSFGGLLTIHTLLHHPELFTDYLALDPSFWWDDQRLLKESGLLLAGIKGNISLYLARAGAHLPDEKQIPAEDARQWQLDFADILAQHHEENSLQWEYRNFEDETHGSIFLVGTYNGLKYLFKPE